MIPDVGIAIIGAGFSGMGAAIKLKQSGNDDFVVLERAADVGGTWRDNTYPGCQCDVPSHLYSFSFAPNPEWSRTYAPQGEIYDYMRNCADKFGIMPHMRFDHAVEEAAWDDDAAVWRIRTTQGEITTRILISGTGGLSEPRLPDVPGLDEFAGDAFHSAQWNHDVDLRGKRVAVVGTGASAIQIVPRIQPEVAQLVLFQRTPPWVLPHTDRPIRNIERRLYRRFPILQRAVRTAIYWTREVFVVGLAKFPRLTDGAQRLALRNLHKGVRDPELRAKLTPGYRLGCKRVLLSDDYYPALAQPNVTVTTGGITKVLPNAVVATDGSEHEVDVIIYATGFDVMERPAMQHTLGRDGRSLAESWQGSPQAYLGSSVAGFPNMFMLLGPNTGLGHTSVVLMIEAQIAHVMKVIQAMSKDRLVTVDVRKDVLSDYNARIDKQMRGTVWTSGGCESWYIDANGRNSTLWPTFTWRFMQRTRSFDAANYVTTSTT